MGIGYHMKCKKCGELNNAGCYFEIKSKEDLKEFKMTHPDTVWLCYYDCYPTSFKIKEGYPI
jgi:hypothetical protein